MQLGSTLVFVSLISVMAFTTVSLSISHLSVSKRLDNSSVASNLSESAANEALARIMETPAWAEDLEIKLESAPGGLGRVAFTRDAANRWGIGLSTNNLNTSSSVEGAGRIVPGETVHIISWGKYRGVVRQHELVVAVPPFQYALVSTGKIQADGGLMVASVDDPAVLADGLARVPAELIKAGSLASNDDDPSAAIKLQANSKVLGSVKSVGGIELGANTQITGSVQPFAEAAEIPPVDIATYDPIDRSDVVQSTAANLNRFEVTKPTRQSGKLTVTNGLHMKGGYLYVDGDLDVSGGLHGSGAVFVTGKVHLSGVSTFSADAREALVARGDVTISGSDRENSIFQGVIYTEGNLRASDVTLVGTMIGNKADGSEITLSRVNLVHSNQTLDTVWSAGLGFDVGAPYTANSFFDLGQGKFKSSPSQKASVQVVNRNKAKDFYDARKDRFTLSPSDHTVNLNYSIRIPRYSSVEGLPTQYYQYGDFNAARAMLANAERKEQVVAAANLIDEMLGGFGGFTLPGIPGLMPPVEVPPLVPPPSAASPDFIAAVQNRYNSGRQFHQWEVLGPAIEAFDKLYQQHHYPWMRQGAFGFTFNPNQFIQTSGKARKVLWRELPGR